MMDRGCELHDSALGSVRSAPMTLHYIHALDRDPSGLWIHLEHSSPLAFVLAGDDLHRITLGDVQAHPDRGLVADPLCFLEHERLHATKPPEPVTRFSYSASRGAHAPPVRRCA